jgi:hypothetical protein
MTGPLQLRIADSVRTGTPLVVDYAQVLAGASNPGGPVVHVTVPIGAALSTIERVAGILRGGSLSSLVPQALLPSGAIALESVIFTLFTADQTIGEISCLVTFGQDGQGLDWKIASIGRADLQVGLKTLLLQWIGPGTSGQYLAAQAAGRASLGTFRLSVDASFPQPTLTFTQDGSVVVGDFFAQIGLPAVGIGFLDDLLLEQFELEYAFSQSQFSLASLVAGEDGAPVTLIPGPGGTPILAFDRMQFAFISAGGDVRANIQGELLVRGKLALNVQAARTADGSWNFAGDIDIRETWQNCHPGQTPPDTPTVGLPEFAQIFGASVNPPSALPSVGIAALSIAYSYAANGSKSYSINGVFDGNWSLADNLTAVLTIALDRQTDDKGAVQEHNLVSAEFDLAGVAFTLSYTFGNDAKTIDASVVAGDLISLSGSYATDTKVVTLTFDKALRFDALLAWFVAEVTGNRYFTLPDPWDDVLSRVQVPQGLTLTINTKSKAVTCTVPNLGISFLGFTLKGLTVGYDPSTKKRGVSSGLTVKIDSDLPDWITSGTWDPGTQAPPKVPGSKAALLDIKLLAAGQHVGFQTLPANVADAVEKLGTALDPTSWTGGLFPAGTMKFDKDVGWLIGSHVLILGQVDIKFIFNDPTIYGLSLIVNSGDSKLLNVLVPLSAEIVYRKVSDTVGVYDGTLTLPSSIAKIDFNAVQITLPQLALSIYTNGDFKIDVGFPYNRDFSRSASVTGGEYSGAGGFYYAKLDGLDPATLPHIDTTKGVFSPVTEIGIGFQIGVTKGFSSGPLSASFSIMLQALFQGTFAKYTQISDNRQDEFYAVDATLAIVGHLVGKIDFAIITASLEVTIYIEVDLTLIAYRQAVAQVTVGVSVELTVKINCGLFSIHIHCSFSTTLHTQASFGSNGRGLWEDALAPPGTARVAAVQQPAHRMLRAAAPVALAVAAGPSIGWQPIADTNPLTAWFIPQLTAGLGYPQTDGQTRSWYYVGQLALSNPAAGAGVTLVNQNDPSYANFVRGMLRWALYAINNAPSQTPVAVASADAKTVSRADVQALQDALADAGRGAYPGIADTQAQLKAAFQITVGALTGTAKDFGVGFFPLLPGMRVSLQADTQAAVTVAAVSLSDAQLAAARQGQPGAPPTTFLAPPVTTAGAATAAQPIGERIMIEFAMLAVRSAVQKLLDTADLLPAGAPVAIGTLLGRLAPALGAISGMTTRFMLHGTRQPADAGALPQPLYALTGQQLPLAPAALGAKTLSMTLAFATGAPADWGVRFAGGGTSLTVSSADTNASVFAPNKIPATPAFAPIDPQWAPMPVADVRPARFYLKTGIMQDGGPGLWQLPQALADHLAVSSGSETFATYFVAGDATDLAAPGTPTAATFVFSIDFRVRRIPANDGTGRALDNTYEIFDVDQGGIRSLQQLVSEIAAGATPVAALSLAYASEPTPTGSGGSVQRKAVIAAVNFVRTFIVQSNFSTETRPPPTLLRAGRMAVAPIDAEAIKLFLTKLWTAGITNSGGYYLFAAPPAGSPGLPPALFDTGGIATLTLIADLAISDGANPVALPAYTTGLRTTTQHPVGGSGALYLASDQLPAVRAVLPPGHLGIDVSCQAPPPPANPGTYDNALNHLYNLITDESVTIGGKPLVRAGLPPVFGPLDPDGGSGGRWHYRHVVPLVADLPAAPDQPPTPPPPLPSEPPAAYNPYAFIGQPAAVALVWTDIFGNEWGPVLSAATGKPPAIDRLAYIDPLVSLRQLPNLTLDYTFTGAGAAAQLQIGFAFTPPTYAPTDGVRRRNDIAAYARAWYQLAELSGTPQVSATVTTSLVLSSGVPTAIPVGVDVIRRNLAKIYATLSARGLDAPQAQPLPLDPIAVPVPGGGTLNLALKFPLSVTLTCTRTGPIAAGFPADGPVRTVSIDIAPRTLATSGDAHSLDAFAGALEGAFGAQSMVLAVGANEAQGGAANAQQLWVLRYGAWGLTVNFPANPAPAYFAPQPLRNVLQSAAVSVQPIDPSTGDFGADQTIKVADVDLDAQMQKFLAAVDNMFSAADAIPAALVNVDAIKSLSAAKKTIVEQLVGYVTDLGSGIAFADGTRQDGSKYTAADPIFVAADRYRQECLIRLGAFYDMNAAAVARAVAGFGGAADPKFNVFGHSVPRQAVKDDQFTFTSGKAPLVDPAGAPMAFGLFAKQASAYAQYSGDRDFIIDAIEHDVVPVTTDGTTYQVGAWLKLVRPQPALGIPTLNIPIPLRAFPQPPQLARQFAVELIADPQAPPTADPNVLLKRAKSWSLNGTYVHAYAAQDRVHLDVRINVDLTGSGARMLRGAAKRPLLETLVAFNYAYPQLQEIFAKNNLAAIRTPEAAANATVLKQALASFAALVSEISDNSIWPVPVQPPARTRLMAAAPVSLPERESFYTITDGVGAQSPTDPWRTTVAYTGDGTGKKPVGIIPQIRIDGYVTQVESQSAAAATYRFVKDGTPLDAGTGSQIAARTITVMPPYPPKASDPFAPLDIVDRQNGLLAMMILRNEGLPASFQYQTPWIAYTQPLAPTLDTNLRIDVSGVGQPNGTPARRSLAAHLTALFAALVQGSGFGVDAALPGSFQLAAFFTYPLMTAAKDVATSPAAVELPILLRLTTRIDYDAPITAPPQFATEMATFIADWLAANVTATGRTDLWDHGEVRLDLSLFSSVSQTGRPIARLRNLVIPCVQIG